MNEQNLFVSIVSMWHSIGFLLGRLVAMVEHDETEKEGTGHHRERRNVVWISRWDEPFVGRMTQWMNRNLEPIDGQT